MKFSAIRWLFAVAFVGAGLTGVISSNVGCGGSDDGKAGSTGSAGSSGTGTAGTSGGGGGGGGCSIGATAPTAGSVLLVALSLLFVSRRRRR